MKYNLLKFIKKNLNLIVGQLSLSLKINSFQKLNKKLICKNLIFKGNYLLTGVVFLGMLLSVPSEDGQEWFVDSMDRAGIGWLDVVEVPNATNLYIPFNYRYPSHSSLQEINRIADLDRSADLADIDLERMDDLDLDTPNTKVKRLISTFASPIYSWKGYFEPLNTEYNELAAREATGINNGIIRNAIDEIVTEHVSNSFISTGEYDDSSTQDRFLYDRYSYTICAEHLGPMVQPRIPEDALAYDRADPYGNAEICMDIALFFQERIHNIESTHKKYLFDLCDTFCERSDRALWNGKPQFWEISRPNSTVVGEQHCIRVPQEFFNCRILSGIPMIPKLQYAGEDTVLTVLYGIPIIPKLQYAGEDTVLAVNMSYRDAVTLAGTVRYMAQGLGYDFLPNHATNANTISIINRISEINGITTHFSIKHNKEIAELKYHLIDYTVSRMLNSPIKDVRIAAFQNFSGIYHVAGAVGGPSTQYDLRKFTQMGILAKQSGYQKNEDYKAGFDFQLMGALRSLHNDVFRIYQETGKRAAGEEVDFPIDRKRRNELYQTMNKEAHFINRVRRILENLDVRTCQLHVVGDRPGLAHHAHRGDITKINLINYVVLDFYKAMNNFIDTGRISKVTDKFVFNNENIIEMPKLDPSIGNPLLGTQIMYGPNDDSLYENPHLFKTKEHMEMYLKKLKKLEKLEKLRKANKMSK